MENVIDPVAGRDRRLEVASSLNPPSLGATVGKRPVEARLPLIR